jgi:mono/diheme cytochrome c family protein
MIPLHPTAMKLYLVSLILATNLLSFDSNCLADDPALSKDALVDFERDVLPVLKQRCFECHGGDSKEAGLTLDQAEAAMQGGDSGKSIIPGNSAGSRIIDYVSGTNPDHVMPPEGDRLTEKEIGLLRQWIDNGAKWPDSYSTSNNKNTHWAYQPLSEVIPPLIGNSSRVINPIDQFVISKLESKGLELSPEANRATLIRRLSLDLLGLLPSVAEVDAFVNDPNSAAYENLLERLLQSPHFGERWGRHWLDLARYADSDGYEKDNPRPDAYRWRDWVIDAINADMPFDQFTREQLAGDLLPNPTDMQRLATAFHRQTLTNTEGGADQEQFRVEACFDRTETTGAVWLGLTVGCARCHSHKYDAISQREYYQLFAFFNNGDEQTHVVPKSDEEVEAYRLAKVDYDAKLMELTNKVKTAKELLGDTVTNWEKEAQTEFAKQLAQPLKRFDLADSKVTSESGLNFTAQEDGSFLASGSDPESAVYVILGKATAAFDSLRVEALSDKSLPGMGPGRANNGNFVLSEVIAELASKEDFSDAVPLEFGSAAADHEQTSKSKSYLAKHAFDKDDTTGWAIAQQFGKNHWIEFRLKEHQEASEGRFVRVTLKQLHGSKHTLGRFKLTLQSGHSPSLDVPQDVAEILAVAAESRSEQQRERLLDHVSRITPSTKPLIDQLNDFKKTEPAKPELSVRVIAQRSKNPRTTFVLRRGEFLEPLTDSEVQPGGLRTLPALYNRNATDLSAGEVATPSSGSQLDRLDLANWLVAIDNPLTPRVTVNHIWRHLFGAGLVRTTNDFGVRGDSPTHPELLDWLASEFIGKNSTGSGPSSGLEKNRRWSRKSLIRLICMSATYRQSSRQSPIARELDPKNELLSRQSRLRVEGEIVRDISLQAAGLLSVKVGGPSVYPSLPPGVAELSYAGNFKWTVSPGADQYRRGMYTFFKRTSPHPNLLAFDCPDANLACIDRGISNTPLQALVALNNAWFTDAARAFADRTLALPEDLDDARRLSAAARIALSRNPSQSETTELLSFYENSRAWYKEHPDVAKKLIENSSAKNLPPEQHAAWIATMRLLINLDEFITRE